MRACAAVCTAPRAGRAWRDEPPGMVAQLRQEQPARAAIIRMTGATRRDLSCAALRARSGTVAVRTDRQVAAGAGATRAGRPAAPGATVRSATSRATAAPTGIAGGPGPSGAPSLNSRRALRPASDLSPETGKDPVDPAKARPSDAVSAALPACASGHGIRPGTNRRTTEETRA
ncbi:hypothetical protein OB2597_00185 [Pseudooceanicola batsensis HTCC2597]|uniref:Uncharacterized protein n=1 Tax=Pseudooceanicola batsensis (strain ATCC BAA-863 / DSM 15984 / KCTC 12145 / HTCC2597) TaxID=252305 RepID=A3U1K7_PSEBH|nr:hypothetical protein OB2597_00185 [Pseudooceanicola batsensis HTCC2597]